MEVLLVITPAADFVANKVNLPNSQDVKTPQTQIIPEKNGQNSFKDILSKISREKSVKDDVDSSPKTNSSKKSEEAKSKDEKKSVKADETSRINNKDVKSKTDEMDETAAAENYAVNNYIQSFEEKVDVDSVAEESLESADKTELSVNAAAEETLFSQNPSVFDQEEKSTGDNLDLENVELASIVENVISEEHEEVSEKPEISQTFNSSAKKVDSKSDSKIQKIFDENIDFNSEENMSEKLNLSEDIPVQQANEAIQIVDQRSEIPEEKLELESTKNIKAEIVQIRDNQIDVTYTLQNQSAQNILASNDQTAQASGSTFQQMLTQQIGSNVPDFVKAGTIILKDNNQGTINLNLKPESLGNVKINLQLSDKSITGVITVSSKEAMEAFKQNLDSFKQSFQQQGFDNANITLAMNDNASSNNFAQGHGQQSANEFFSRKVYSDYSSSSESFSLEEDLAQHYTKDSDYYINVVA